MEPNSPTNEPTAELKGRKLAFALAYIALGPVKGRITQAAEKAGTAKHAAAKQGSKWLKMGDVAAYIRAREGVIIKHLEEKQLVTAEWIVRQLQKVYAQSMVGEPEMVWQDGELVHSGLYTFNDRGANRSLELLGKTIGMFSDKKDADDGLGGFSLVINLEKPQPNKPPEGQVIEHQAQPPQPNPALTINLEPPA